MTDKIRISRALLRSLPGQPRRAPWIYSYEVEGGPSCLHWGTSIVALREMLKRRYPGCQITEDWK